MKNQTPSTILIQTWIEFAQNNKFPEAQQIVIDKINAIFGSVYEAELYVEKERLNGLRKAS